MMKPNKTQRPSSSIAFFRSLGDRYEAGWGIWVLLGSLLVLSLIAGASFESAPKIYATGQIAEADVVADRELRVEDPLATRARKQQVLAMQPAVYDLSFDAYAHMQSRILELFKALGSDKGMKSQTVKDFIDEIGQNSSEEILRELERPAVQTYILKSLLPVIREQLARGLVWDARIGRVGSAGIILRNLDAGTETLRSDIDSIPDTQTFLAELAARTGLEKGLTQGARRAINVLISATLPASLTLNREATQKRSAEIAATVAPVFYQIQKGEVILRKGERVNNEQQLKLQNLYNSTADPVRWHVVGGTLLCSLIFSMGFFITPSGKPGRPLHLKDLILISILLLFFGLGAKCTYLFGSRMDSLPLLNSFALAYPVAGAVGLGAMIFAARRYCTMGLLSALFACVMFQSGIELFIYYFLGAMAATWLVTRAQNRQDVVWSIIPLVLSLLIIWAAMAMLAQTPLEELPMLAVAVIINALLSLIILFAMSPVLEMLFNYSTRFRLMELMSMEQPLMQEISVAIPGTHHHSAVVSNLVEAGAKAIGANSLLAKVAALYHDVGKLSYPEYFIENQFGAPNKHDKLAPSMSALILLSHIKKGTELAEKYNLGQDIIDIIRQHHGTRLMRYFYQKAINLGEKPQEGEYSYPGPKPQSKEAAILMLADSVEASSRTLADPTPARIRTHIDNIIKGIFAEGQLDESELTFKDLHHLSESFQRILTGMFHHRIPYPGEEIKNPGQTRPVTKGVEGTQAPKIPTPAPGETQPHKSHPPD